MMEALIPLLAVFKDPVNMVLVLVIIGMGWFIKTTRAEDREDKGKMVDALKEVNATLIKMGNFLSAHAGKVIE